MHKSLTACTLYLIYLDEVQHRTIITKYICETHIQTRCDKMRMDRDGSEDLSTCQWICDLSWPTNPLQVNWKVPKPRYNRNLIWYVWTEVKVWYISWIVCKAVSLSIFPFVSESYKLKWVQRNIHQRHWFGGVCMITFMSVSSFPISQEVTAKCSNFSRDQLP